MTVWRSVPRRSRHWPRRGSCGLQPHLSRLLRPPRLQGPPARTPLSLPGMCFKIKISGGSGSSPGRFRPPGSIRFSRQRWTFSVEFYTQSGNCSRRFCASLFGIFTGASSGGTVAVWLIVAALLAWSIWKLCPVIVRWLSGQCASTKQARGSNMANAGRGFRPVRASRPGVPRWNACRGDPAGTPGADCPVGETRSASLRHDSDQPRVPDGASPQVGARRVLWPTGADLRTGLVWSGAGRPCRSRTGDQPVRIGDQQGGARS